MRLEKSEKVENKVKYFLIERFNLSVLLIRKASFNRMKDNTQTMKNVLKCDNYSPKIIFSMQNAGQS